MASLLGPQWLCECNRSGGAETVRGASEAAAKHFLDHGMTDSAAVDNAEDNFYTVSVYKKRGQWLYTISNPSQAREIAFPWRDATQGKGATALTTSMMLPPGAVVQISDSINGTYTHTVAVVDGVSTETLTKADTTPPTGRFTSQWLPGQPIELGSLTMAEANAQFQATVQAMLASSPRSRPISVTEATRGY